MISDQDRYVYCAICGEPSTILLPGADGRKWGSCDDHAPGTLHRQAEMIIDEDEGAWRKFEDRADDEAHQLPEYRV